MDSSCAEQSVRFNLNSPHLLPECLRLFLLVQAYWNALLSPTQPLRRHVDTTGWVYVLQFNDELPCSDSVLRSSEVPCGSIITRRMTFSTSCYFGVTAFRNIFRAAAWTSGRAADPAALMSSAASMAGPRLLFASSVKPSFRSTSLSLKSCVA